LVNPSADAEIRDGYSGGRIGQTFNLGENIVVGAQAEQPMRGLLSIKRRFRAVCRSCPLRHQSENQTVNSLASRRTTRAYPPKCHSGKNRKSLNFRSNFLQPWGN
jgi:hypothetical protein